MSLSNSLHHSYIQNNKQTKNKEQTKKQVLAARKINKKVTISI